MTPVLHGTSACASSAFAPPTTNKLVPVWSRWSIVAKRWMDQDATWYRGRFWPRRHCVRWGPSSPHEKGHSSHPHFWAHVFCGQAVAHLSNCWALVLFCLINLCCCFRRLSSRTSGVRTRFTWKVAIKTLVVVMAAVTLNFCVLSPFWMW